MVVIIRGTLKMLLEYWRRPKVHFFPVVPSMLPKISKNVSPATSICPTDISAAIKVSIPVNFSCLNGMFFPGLLGPDSQ